MKKQKKMNDHQVLYLQLQMSAPPDRISGLLHSMQSCISDVKAWATANMLKLNDSKTELMLVTSKRSKHLHNLPTSITIGNAQIPFKQSVKNLGFTLDCHLNMNAHVSNIARTCYFELRRLASNRRFLTSTATATLISAFVLSRIDYCNSLLFGIIGIITIMLGLCLSSETDGMSVCQTATGLPETTKLLFTLIIMCCVQVLHCTTV